MLLRKITVLCSLNLMRLLCCFFLSFLNSTISMASAKEGKTLHINNMSNVQIYIAVYCSPPLTGASKRITQVYAVPPHDAIDITRPKSSMSCSRYIYFSYHNNDLTPSIDRKSTIGSVGVGKTTGGGLFSSFYILPINGKLNGYSSAALKVKDVLLKITAMLKTGLTFALESAVNRSILVHENPNIGNIAHVRIGDTLCDEEADFVTQRKQTVRTALEKLTGRQLNGSYIPTIACISSGGGARALIGSLGFHAGAEEIGLLDTVTYDAGLSGGSWFVGLWHQNDSTIAEFKRSLAPIAAKGLNPTRPQDFGFDDVKHILKAILVRKGIKQPTTMVTLWGSMLANRYLQPYEPRSQAILFSTFAQRTRVYSRPLPLIAAVDGYAADLGKSGHAMGWFEISPFEASGVGGWLGHASVATWAFGRKFEGNTSDDMQPEYDLGQLMGISGSAFAVTIGRAFAEMPIISVPASYILRAVVGEDTAATKRISVGKAPNFTQLVANSTIRNQPDIRLVDGAMAFNIPTPLFMHKKRKADIMIIFDMSGGLEKDNADGTLGGTQRYAAHHRLPFPTMDLKNVAKESLSIFTDPKNLEAPLVLYLPRIIDRKNITYPNSIPKGYNTDLSTLQFQYDAQAFNNLSGVTQANIVGNKQKIIDAIVQNIEAHKGFVGQ